MKIKRFYVDIDSLFLANSEEISPTKIFILVTLFHKVKHMFGKTIIHVYITKEYGELLENKISKLVHICQLYEIGINIGKFCADSIFDNDVLLGHNFESLNIPKDKHPLQINFLASNEIDIDFNRVSQNIHNIGQSLYRSIYFFYDTLNANDIW